MIGFFENIRIENLLWDFNYLVSKFSISSTIIYHFYAHGHFYSCFIVFYRAVGVLCMITVYIWYSIIWTCNYRLPAHYTAKVSMRYVQLLITGTLHGHSVHALRTITIYARTTRPQCLCATCNYYTRAHYTATVSMRYVQLLRVQCCIARAHNRTHHNLYGKNPSENALSRCVVSQINVRRVATVSMYRVHTCACDVCCVWRYSSTCIQLRCVWGLELKCI